MSILELERLLGHSLDDNQMNRDFSLDRARQTDHGLRWRGGYSRPYPPEKEFARTRLTAEEASHDSREP